jgi:4-amino-4-deoxy-L-arabinose transferase-like glycosyltransferase
MRIDVCAAGEDNSSHMSSASSRLTRAQWLIVMAHLALAVLYGALIPPWEAHDETGHFSYVNHVVNTRSLPDARDAEQELFEQTHQPPLYYLVASGLTFWIDRSDALEPQLNPWALDGTNRRGFRVMLRQPEEVFPWQGTVLALHGARVVSALLTASAVLLIALSANAIFGRGTPAAALSTAIAAFNPQFIFMGAMVNNDAMVALAGAAVGYGLLAISQASNVKRQAFVLLGVSLGIAFLSKNNALALIPFTGIALLFIAWRNRWALLSLIVNGAITFGAFSLVAAPYVLYTWTRYGRLLLDRNPDNPLINQPTSAIGEGLFVSIRDAWLPQLFANTFRTFWGKFGWGNVGMDEWAYALFALFTLAGVAGCIIGWRRAQRPLRTALTVLLMMGAMMMALPLYRAIFFQDPMLMPGRYLMPALTAYACLLGFGWATLSAERKAQNAERNDQLPITNYQSLIIPSALAGFALLIPFLFILPRYAPTLIAANNAPALLTFGNLAQVTRATARAELLPDREGMRPYARVSLDWRALNATDQQYVFGISVLGRDNEVLGTMNVYPNRGNFPSTHWRAGDAFRDEYDILLEKPCATLPALGRLSVSVFQLDAINNMGPFSVTPSTSSGQAALPALDGEGREIAPIVGRFKIPEAPPMPVFWQPPLASFDGIWLREAKLPAAVRAGETLTATLLYEMVQPNGKAGTAFVHVLDASGTPIAQDDHVPQGGNYPTDLWDAGECVRESFKMTLPPNAAGPFRVVTGFYATADQQRFHTQTPDNLVEIGAITLDQP